MQQPSSALTAALISIDARVTPRVLVDLFDVSPLLARNNSRDRGHGDTVLPREVLKSHFAPHVLLSNGLDRLNTQLSVVTLCALGLAITIHHLSRVIRWRAYLKVLRVNTRRVIAFVEHKHAVRDWAVSPLVRHPAGDTFLAAPVDTAVSQTRTVAVPNPTGIGLGNKRPKVRGRCFVGNQARAGTVFTGATFPGYLTQLPGEGITARFTDAKRAGYSWVSHDLNLIDRSICGQARLLLQQFAGRLHFSTGGVLCR